MTPEELDSLDKPALIQLVLAQAKQIELLTARVAELETRLNQPPKTPGNSSVPPSKGQKPSGSSAPKSKAKPHRGAHRPLHPNPTSKRAVLAATCQGCGADVSGVAQIVCEEYDRVEIPRIEPDVTRVQLHSGVCPCCARRFKAEPPVGLEPGSPFGPNLRAFVIYLRSVHGIPLARLRTVLADLFGLEISAGALVNILAASAEAFAAQTDLIKARMLAGTVLASDETGLRVGKANWWLWVFHHADSAVFLADQHRSRAVVEAFLGEHRPDYWISDRYGGQMGWARREHQVCLAHLIRARRAGNPKGVERARQRLPVAVSSRGRERWIVRGNGLRLITGGGLPEVPTCAVCTAQDRLGGDHYLDLDVLARHDVPGGPPLTLGFGNATRAGTMKMLRC